MSRERWLVTRTWDAVLWRVETYHADQSPPALQYFDSTKAAATSLADGDPVSISETHETDLGSYVVVTIDRKDVSR